jgi:hypothetical protein
VYCLSVGRQLGEMNVFNAAELDQVLAGIKVASCLFTRACHVAYQKQSSQELCDCVRAVAL